MSGVTTTYTNTGTIIEVGVSSRITPQSPFAYVCPQNTIAKVSGTMIVDDVGSASKIALAVKRYGSNPYYPIGEMVVNDGISFIPSYVILHQYDAITSVGNNGNQTGTADIDLAVQEIQQLSSLTAMVQNHKQLATKKKEEKKNVRNK